ncbi:DUF3422 domain-containing protein [Ochrobactrum anthropi ATCC 49188]|nr:DUF3422 domain-containing protein [Brucella anthropi ATCC 49188]
MTKDYPWRSVLNDELHSRPSIYFDAPAVVWHEAFCRKRDHACSRHSSKAGIEEYQ